MEFLQKIKLKKLLKKLTKLHNSRIENGKGSITDEITAYFNLAAWYNRHKKQDPCGIFALECYRAAANLGNASAQYLCGKELMDKGCFWDKWSTGLFGNKIHQKYAADYFAEGLSYLIEAEQQEHPLAKRLHGIAYIRGWGLQPNSDEGFQLIIASLEQEKAWDRATQIFEELGLNTPEFFAKLIAKRPPA